MVFPQCLPSISTFSADVTPSVSQMNRTSSGQLFKIKLKVNYLRQQGNTVKVLCKCDWNKTQQHSSEEKKAVIGSAGWTKL